MSHDRDCKIDSRVFRIDQLAYRICKAQNQHEAKQWRRDLRKAMIELNERVDAHCEALSNGAQREATASSQNGGRVSR